MMFLFIAYHKLVVPGILLLAWVIIHVLPLDHYYTYMTTLSIRVLALADKYSPCKRIYIVYTPELSQTYITLVGASSSMQYFLKIMSP